MKCICKNCNIEFKRIPSKVKRSDNLYCSKFCYGQKKKATPVFSQAEYKLLGQLRAGSDNPFWKGGIENTKITSRAWYQKNYESVLHRGRLARAKKRNAVGTFNQTEWELLKSKYDHRCLKCYEKEPKIKLTTDHIIPLILGGSNYIENIQPLCKSCNSSKKSKIIDYR